MNKQTIFLQIKKNKAAITLTLVFFIIITQSFYVMFETNSEVFENYNTMIRDWEPMIKWIRDNTTSSDRFLTTSNPRQWAWFIDRQVFQLSLFDVGVEIPFQNVSSSNLIEIIGNFNITYLIIDSSVSKNPELSYLFDFSDSKINPLFSSNIDGIDVNEFILEKKVLTSNKKVILYEVLSSTNFIINQLNELNATFETVGNISINDDGRVDIITDPAKDATYLTCKFRPGITINDASLVVYVGNSTNSVGGALTLKFSNIDLFFSYISPGIYIYPLESMGSNGTLDEIALYASLRQGEGYFTVSYSGIWLIKPQNP